MNKFYVMYCYTKSECYFADQKSFVLSWPHIVTVPKTNSFLILIFDSSL